MHRPLAALSSPPGNPLQPTEGALNLLSYSSQRPCLALGIIASLLLCGEGAELSPHQATQSFMAGMQDSLVHISVGTQPHIQAGP